VDAAVAVLAIVPGDEAGTRGTSCSATTLHIGSSSALSWWASSVG